MALTRKSFAHLLRGGEEFPSDEEINDASESQLEDWKNKFEGFTSDDPNIQAQIDRVQQQIEERLNDPSDDPSGDDPSNDPSGDDPSGDDPSNDPSGDDPSGDDAGADSGDKSLFKDIGANVRKLLKLLGGGLLAAAVIKAMASELNPDTNGTCTVNGKADASIQSKDACTKAGGTWKPKSFLGRLGDALNPVNIMEKLGSEAEGALLKVGYILMYALGVYLALKLTVLK